MRVNVYNRKKMKNLINVRDVDAIGEQLYLSDDEMDQIEESIRNVGFVFVGPYYLKARD